MEAGPEHTHTERAGVAPTMHGGHRPFPHTFCPSLPRGPGGPLAPMGPWEGGRERDREGGREGVREKEGGKRWEGVRDEVERRRKRQGGREG